jgi:tetratricopeptide (TPR) repeat protein
MNPSSLPPEMLAGLAHHLFQEGSAALEQGKAAEAISWFAQCLDTLRQLGNNENFISIILYQTGLLYGSAGRNEEALAFFEASADIQRQEPLEKSTADMLLSIGRVIAMTGYSAVAQWVLRDALAMYDVLDLSAEINEVRQELGKWPAEPARASHQPHRFAIQVGQQLMSRFTVGPDGTVTWLEVPAGGAAIPAGRVYPWTVTFEKD